MEYLEESLDEWLGDELEAFGEDDYVVFDCPGQIELYTNTSVFRAFVRFLQSAGWQARRRFPPARAPPRTHRAALCTFTATLKGAAPACTQIFNRASLPGFWSGAMVALHCAQCAANT